MQYITSAPVRPRYRISPYFLDRLNLSVPAKQLYEKLLERAYWSQSNGKEWMDADGRVFIRCSVAEAGEMIGRKGTVVKEYLKELDKAGLIYRKRNWSASSTIYVGYPDDEELFNNQLDGKPSNRIDSQPENRPIVGRKTVHTSAGKPSTNLLIHNQHNTEIVDVTASTPKKFIPPSLEEARAYFVEKGSSEPEAEKFVNHFDSIGWKVGRARTPMKKWKSAANNWIENNREWNQQKNPAKSAEKEYKDL